MIDHFTRFLVTVMIQSSTVVTVAHNSVDHWISFFGAPATILMDRVYFSNRPYSMSLLDCYVPGGSGLQLTNQKATE